MDNRTKAFVLEMLISLDTICPLESNQIQRPLVDFTFWLACGASGLKHKSAFQNRHYKVGDNASEGTQVV